MKYKIIKVIKNDGTESYTIKKRTFLGYWKTETYVHLSDYGPIEFRMDRLTLDEVKKWIEYIKEGNNKYEETIKEFKV